MFKQISELRMAQADGSLPTAVAAGSAPGESGVFVFAVRFHGGGHVSATAQLHHICIQVTPCAHIDCRIADETLSHRPSRGCVAICPSGADCSADGEGSVEAIIVAIDPGQFALAAAEGSAFEAELIARLSTYDQALFDLARSLAMECADGYPSGIDMQDTFVVCDGDMVTTAFYRHDRSRAARPAYQFAATANTPRTNTPRK